MVLLDRVAEMSPERCVALWTVPAASPWIEEGRLLRAAFVEIAAQTAAAHTGAGGGAPQAGHLGGVAEFRVHGDAQSGDVLRSTAARGPSFGTAARYECRIERIAPGAATLLAEGSLSVARTERDAAAG